MVSRTSSHPVVRSEWWVPRGSDTTLTSYCFSALPPPDSFLQPKPPGIGGGGSRRVFSVIDVWVQRLPPIRRIGFAVSRPGSPPLYNIHLQLRTPKSSTSAQRSGVGGPRILKTHERGITDAGERERVAEYWIGVVGTGRWAPNVETTGE